jgi:hypothetical protein
MFDAVSEPTPLPKPPEDNLLLEEKKEGRKFIGVKFNCCGIYKRIYINDEGTAYVGCCPKCFRPVKFTVGSGGTDHRFFEAN